MSEGGQGEINICVASVHLPGVPKWFPGCKTLRIPNSKKAREEWIRKEAAPSSRCLSAGDPGGRSLRRRDQRQTEKQREAVCEQI